MRNGKVWVAALLLSVATGWAQEKRGNAKPETLVRWHYAGSDHIKTLSKQKALQSVLGLPETAALRQAALEGFSRNAAARFARNASTNDQAHIAGRIRELFSDILQFESKLEMITTGGSDADWALAVKIPSERQQVWQTLLSDLSTKAGLRVEEQKSGWSASHENYRLSLAREKNWAVLTGGYGPANPRLFNEFRRNLDKRSGKSILSIDADLPRLGEVWKAQRLSHAPRLVLQATPNGDGFRSNIELTYPQKIEIKPEKFVPPTTVMREPIIGFTAVQGVRNAVKASPHFQGLGAAEIPNQLFAWAVGDTPFSAYFAAEVGNPTVIISNVVTKLLPSIRSSNSMFGFAQPHVSSNYTAFVWRGFPIAMPHLNAGTGPASEFLVAGLFPVATGTTNPVPRELFEQLKQKNLVYYDWEITEGRIAQWRPIWQWAHIVSGKRMLNTQAASERWLSAIGPKLGNAVTEATLEGDRKIKVVRQSHLGLTSLELVLFAHFVDPFDFREQGARTPTPNQARPSQTPPPSGNSPRP